MVTLHVLDDSFRVFPPTASDFGHPEQCRQCHQRQYDEWIGSMHAYGQVSPVFIAFNNAVRNMGTGVFCVRCHTPIGIEIGEDGVMPNDQRAPISIMGVQCDMCHTVEKDYGLVSANFPLSPGRTKYGPFGSGTDGDPKAVRNSFHRSVKADFLKTSEFCGSCHDVVSQSGLRIEEAFTEWKESVYAEKGITCQDCHMRTLPGQPYQKKVMGPAAIMFGVKLPDRPLSDHSFIGPDNHLIDSFPYPDNPEETARIQRAYLEKKKYLLENCATVEIVAPDKVSPASEFQVEVQVTNTKAGHGIPTGFTAERQVWIEIIVRDAKDRVLFLSGDLDSNKDLRNSHSHAVKVGEVPLDEWLVNFQSQFIYVPRQGVEEEVLLPPLATYVKKHNIMPFETKSGFYPITVPPDAVGPLKVDVRLRYRNLPPYLLDLLEVSELKDRLVIVDMASASSVIETE
jgi:nitrate/TMAO reductase-like tetraheme cytochrome c subunit